MRWVAIGLVFLSLPAFITLLMGGQIKRNTAMSVISFLFFVPLHIDPSLIAWPFWKGLYVGVQISPLDTLALALWITRRRHTRAIPFLGVITLYCIPVLASCAIAPVPMASMFYVYSLARSVFLFIVIAGEVRRPNALRDLTNGASFGLMIQAAVVIYQKMHGVVQASGTFAHQNEMGMLVELTVIPLFASLLEGERRKMAIVGVIAALIIIAGGGSRGTLGFVAADMILLAILSIVRRSTPHKFRIVGAGVLVVAMIAPVGMMTLKSRFHNKPVIFEEIEREAFERAAVAMAKDHSFGVGVNQYVMVANGEGYSARAGVPWNPQERSVPVHNAYLLARAETGWAGELALIALLVVPAFAGFRLAFRERKGPEEGIVLGAAISIASVALHSNLEFMVFELLPIFFIDAGIIAGRIQYVASRRSRKVRIKPNPKFAAMTPEPVPA